MIGNGICWNVPVNGQRAASNKLLVVETKQGQMLLCIRQPSGIYTDQQGNAIPALDDSQVYKFAVIR